VANPTSKQKKQTTATHAAYVQATGRSGERHSPSWETAGDWTVVPRLLIELEQHGGAVQFGRKRDGSMLTVKVYGTGEDETFYFDSTEQALLFCELLTSMGGAM